MYYIVCGFVYFIKKIMIINAFYIMYGFTIDQSFYVVTYICKYNMYLFFYDL